MSRRCLKCEAELGVDVDICPVCGANNPLERPWYVWPLGALIVLVLFLLLVDIDDLLRYLELMLGMGAE